MRVVAASATQAPAHSVAKVPDVETKEQGGGPGRIFLSSTRAAAGQLWGVLKFFQAEEEAAMTSGTDSNVLGDTAKRAEQAEKVQDKAKAKKQKEPAADISKYLRGAGLMETRYVRMVSSLCAQTYYMHKLTKESLWRRHRLHLVTTSRAFKSTDALKSAQQTLDEVPFRAVTSRMQNAAAAGQSTAVATIATVTAAVSSNFNKEHSKAPKESQAADPTQWFVCDDPVSHTRYFVIQGSETIDHWRVNLSFDPVVFEDKSLGVKVHRGVYVAAEILYERFKPMVKEQLASSPFAKVAFTGHSLGGSLGTLLMMMYKYRGVLPQTAIAPVYTFGAPAIFYSASDASPDTSATEPITDNHGHQKSQGILQALGLDAGCVRNIFMTRDIVPRAFACDYTLVADLLRRVGEGFREHDCLMGNGRVVMYFFVGKMMVLQPDKEHRFIAKDEPYHDMLPAHPGLWVLRQPNVTAVSKKAAPSLAAMANDAPKGKPAASLRDAVMDLMNYPHPLDTLGEPSAYGPDGAISRYHNPDHYVRALGGVLRTKTRPMRMSFKSSRWYLHLQEKEQAMKRKAGFNITT
ncbi:hypothetical protein WJX82_009173 [Trebouxia sp. C0006]